MKIGQWLKDMLRQQHRSQRALAQHLGVHESVVSRIIAGTRDLSVTELQEVAFFLGVTSPDLSKLSTPNTAPDADGLLKAPVAVLTIPITCVIARGVWRQRGSVVADRTQVPASPDPRVVHLHQYACKIDGVEHDTLVGQFAVCVPYEDLRSAPHESDIVHVIRRRDGDLEEHRLGTVRTHQKVVRIVSLGSDGDDISDGKIVGLCVGIFTPVAY
jgi:transcriptional regulator with XRE-family HTH domain